MLVWVPDLMDMATDMATDMGMATDMATDMGMGMATIPMMKKPAKNHCLKRFSVKALLNHNHLFFYSAF